MTRKIHLGETINSGIYIDKSRNFDLVCISTYECYETGIDSIVLSSEEARILGDVLVSMFKDDELKKNLKKSIQQSKEGKIKMKGLKELMERKGLKPHESIEF